MLAARRVLTAPAWPTAGTLAVVLLTLGAGCATSPAGPAQFRHPADLPAEQRDRLVFTEANTPDHAGCSVRLAMPPPFHQIADSAAIAHAMAARWAAPGAQPGVTVLSVRTDSEGRASRLDILETDLPAELAPLVPMLLADRLRPQVVETDSGPTPRGWQHRIRVHAGPSSGFEVGHVVTCRPSIRNEDALVRLIQEGVRIRRIPADELGRTALAYIQVSESGEAGEVRIQRSSGHRQLDELAVEVAANAFFHPASIDGSPVVVWASVPINFHRPPRRRNP